MKKNHYCRGNFLAEFCVALPVLLLLTVGLADLCSICFQKIFLTASAHSMAHSLGGGPFSSHQDLEAKAQAWINEKLKNVDVKVLPLPVDPKLERGEFHDSLTLSCVEFQLIKVPITIFGWWMLNDNNSTGIKGRALQRIWLKV